MAFPNGRRSLFLSVLLLGVLKRGNTQIICRIEVDSTRGWWRDVTPEEVSTSDATTFCDGFLYRETTLTCPTSPCPSKGSVDGSCTVYYNIDSKGPCLATCNANCKHGSQCDLGTAKCPCQLSHARYDKKRMCVALARLKTCANGELNENNKCIPTSCIEACPNGRCSEDGTCSCLDGFTRDPTSGKCVPRECLEECVDGTCDLSGECVCQDGFEKDEGEAYKCIKEINYEERGHAPGSIQDVCADEKCVNGKCLEGKCKCSDGFQEKQDGGQCSPINVDYGEDKQLPHRHPPGCDRSGCTEANGRCVQGQCQCNDGFRNDPTNKNKCVKIVCPVRDPTNYCQRVCQDSGCTNNGWCETSGECNCNSGFRKDPVDKYKCNKVTCPDLERNSNSQPAYCKNVCKDSCRNGVCSDEGDCVCNQGYQKHPSEKYVCNNIDCQTVWDYDICKARCSANCTNGACHDNGTCICEDGFKKGGNGLYQCNKISCPSFDGLDSAYCKAQCENSCAHGKCGDNGYCTCNAGFWKSSGLYACVAVTCPNSQEASYCMAECKKGCTNGRCSYPGVCQCNAGYKSDTKNKYVCNKINCPSYERVDDVYCKSQCDANCKSGVCDSTGSCSCSYGLKKATPYRCEKIDCASDSQVYKRYCEEQCTRYCHSGNCVDGVRCECKSGFKKTQGKLYECKKINCTSSESNVDNAFCKTQCEGGCQNGMCDDKGVCNCIEGFKKSPPNLYKCDVINCPSEQKDDKPYCTSRCIKNCNNGTCGNGGKCSCNDGFKKEPLTPYQCTQISCPSSVPEDDGFCSAQCRKFCEKGKCDAQGNCVCNASFTKISNKLYMCDEIICPSREGSRWITERKFCKSVCEQQCTKGVCDDLGHCVCSAGFKKNPDGDNNCIKIKCPTSKSEDKAHCRGRCAKSCTNGRCDERGACECHSEFVSTNRSRVDCHHECHDDDSCSLEAILAGIVGGGFAVVVVIIVTAALMIRARNREERAMKDQGSQDVPLATLSEEPEYANAGQEAAAEENDMYHSFDVYHHQGRGRVQ